MEKDWFEGHAGQDVFPDLGPQDALKGARNMAGLSQQESADMIGVAKSNISEMEHRTPAGRKSRAGVLRSGMT